MTELESIDRNSLDTVTGGRNLGPLINRAREWGGRAWNAADKLVTGLGIADAGRRAYDWATGGNQQPSQPSPPSQPSAPEQPSQGGAP